MARGSNSMMSRHFSIVFFSVFIVACASQHPKNTIDEKPIIVELKQAKGIIPQQDYDRFGKKIPYKPMANPYLQDKKPVSAAAKKAFRAANKAYTSKQYVKAKKLFIEMTIKYKDLSGPWVKLAKMSEMKKDYKAAENEYRTAIKLNKKNVNAYLALGLMQRHQGMFSQAQNTYIDALKVWKDFPAAHLNLAVLYDMYLNLPVQSQPHFEAYVFLTGQKDKQAQKWLLEVSRRTKIKKSFIDSPPVIKTSEISGEAIAQ